MKKSFSPLFPRLILLLLFLVGSMSLFSQPQKVELERVKEKCEGLAYKDRVRISVVRFDVTTPKAPRGEFGGELTTMLSSAITQINCFRVLESVNNKDDLNKEIDFANQGYTQSGSSPQRGKMLGAQVIVTGEVTEFYEGKNSAEALGISLGGNVARIGFILKVINPETREIIWAKSIEAKSKKAGAFSGLRLFGIKLAGGSKFNKAVADAMERAIISGAYELADAMEDIPLPEVDNSFAEKKEWNASNCPVLGSGSAPSIMLITGERHISHYLPKPIGETEIINQLVRSGFAVIDPAMYAAIRKGANFKQATLDPMAAISIGNKFGADIVIIGEGVSQRVAGNTGGVSCRATLNLRAIRVDNGQIVMTHSSSAGAVDVAETAAYQNAFKNVGNQAALDFLEQMCTRSNIALPGASALATKGGEAAGSTTIIKIVNVEYADLKKLTEILKADSKITKVNRTSFSGSKATLELKHQGSSDDILDVLEGKGSSFSKIVGFSEGTINLKIK